MQDFIYKDKTKAVAIDRESAMAIVKFLVLFGLASFAPYIGFHSQLITGPIVNAILFIAVYMVGFRNAIFVGLIPSLIAVMTGLLPIVLAPMVPFIMIANVLLMYVFDILKKRDYWTAMISASVVKFLFLWAAGYLVVRYVVEKELAAKIANMVGYYQLLTALAGGVIAWLFLRYVILQFKKGDSVKEG